MNKTLRTVWNIISFTLVGIAIILVILLTGIKLFGFNVYAVLSGSMEPEYKVGSVIYVKDVDVTDIAEGDVITFKLTGNTVATHRVVDIISDENDADVIRFQTKGDANKDVDMALVETENVIGTPVFKIPYLGYIADYIQNPPGIYIIIAACAVILCVSILLDTFSTKEK